MSTKCKGPAITPPALGEKTPIQTLVDEHFGAYNAAQIGRAHV
jgi:hypothetical protein